MKCPYCANEISDNTAFCTYCHSKLTKLCPFCKEEISITETTCPYCTSDLENKQNLKSLDICMYIFTLLNIIYTTLYINYFEKMLIFIKNNDDLVDVVSLSVSISIFCTIPAIISILKDYKIRKSYICIGLNILFCLVCLLASFIKLH